MPQSPRLRNDSGGEACAATGAASPRAERSVDRWR